MNFACQRRLQPSPYVPYTFVNLSYVLRTKKCEVWKVCSTEKTLWTTGCPKKKYPDLVDPSDKNIAWINPKWFSKHTLIANMNIDTSFVEFGALRVKISIFKGQICLHLQTRALALWPKQILEALWMKSTKFEDGTTDVFSIIQFMWDLSSREPRNQLHSSQYRQFI